MATFLANQNELRTSPKPKYQPPPNQEFVSFYVNGAEVEVHHLEVPQYESLAEFLRSKGLTGTKAMPSALSLS